ncbi:MAG TPA: NUDIX domain-containing protein [Candidatus Saccharimonadales bacterium]
MSHIHTDPGQYDHTASVYLFRTDFNEPKIMLHLHKKLGKYMQFGGHIELHETPWGAVVHEVREESGYDIAQISLLQPRERVVSLSDATIHPAPAAHSSHPFGKPGSGHFHTDVAYAAVASEPPRHTPHDDESSDIKMFTRQELVDLPDDQIIANVREIALHIFDNCLGNWEPVPSKSFK